MNMIEALILGMIQGLTEFFPISSSAHLKLAKLLLGLETGKSSVFFDLACHAGTVVVLVLFFRKEIVHMMRFQRQKLLLFLIALAPLIPFYFLLKPVRDAASNLQLIGFFLMATSAILWVGQRWRLTHPSSTKGQTFCIGLMQALALIPGISRSGSTISAARIFGWSAQDAVHFSFLLSIPTILGGMGLETLKIITVEHPDKPDFILCAVGFIASFAMGTFIIGKAVRFLEKGNLKPFAWYCLFAGILATLYLN